MAGSRPASLECLHHRDDNRRRHQCRDGHADRQQAAWKAVRRAACRGILAAQRLKPQAVALAESRGIKTAEIDLAVLRGEREPDLTLFAA